MIVNCKKVTVCDGVDLTEEEYKAFSTVANCLRQVASTLDDVFGSDVISDSGHDFYVSDIVEAVESIQENTFTVPEY